MEQILKQSIESAYEQHSILDKIIKDKATQLEALRLGIQNGDGSLEDKINFLKEKNVDLILFAGEQRIKFDKIFYYIELYKQLGFDSLSQEVLDFYKTNKIFAPTEVFVVKDGNVIEKEEGSLEKARENFIKNNEFMQQLINKS